MPEITIPNITIVDRPYGGFQVVAAVKVGKLDSTVTLDFETDESSINDIKARIKDEALKRLGESNA